MLTSKKTNMMYKTITLKKGKEESLKRFHPWVFSGAIKYIDDGVKDGETVRVLKSNGDFIAVGHFQIGSIAVRVLSFCDVEINSEFFRKRLEEAFRMRKCIGIADYHENNTYRLVHGEGDNLSGLVIDCYGDTAVMQAHSIGMHLCRDTVARELINVTGEKIKNVFYKSETTFSYKTPLGQESGFLIGHSNNNTAIENGLKFHVDWLKGQKTGYFIDQRENRSLIEKYSKGKTVLNMFCYTGGFSLYAMKGGAKVVHSVDSSAKAVELTNANVELNFPNDKRHVAYCDDAFKFLEKSDNKYDLIILDPPAFAIHRKAIHNALKGYAKLNMKAMQRIQPGGILFTFSCSQVVTKDNFRNAVFTAAALAGRRVRILHQMHQAADHPINIYHPEGEYLKGFVLYIE